MAVAKNEFFVSEGSAKFIWIGGGTYCSTYTKIHFFDRSGHHKNIFLKVISNQSPFSENYICELCSPGSTVLDLTMVASGQADAYAHAGVHCWDFAAGALLVREAGGVVLDPSGEDFDLMSGR